MENNDKSLHTKRNKYILIELSVIFVLVVLIILVLGIDNTRRNLENVDDSPNNKLGADTTQDDTLEPNRILNESIDLSTINDADLREQFVNKVLLGNDGVYAIGGNYYVILTNGIRSNYSIEYNSSIDIDGNVVVEKYISDKFEDIPRIRYQIIEVSNKNVKIVQSSTSGIAKAEGLCAVIIYQGDTGMQYINTVTGSSYEYDGLDMPGMYMATINNNKIESTKEINSCLIKNCTAGRKVAGASHTYDIYLQDNTKIQMLSTEQLEEGRTYNLDVSYSKLTGALSVNTKVEV